MRHVLQPIACPICRREQCRVPPSPTLLAELYNRYAALKATGRLSADVSFEGFYRIWRSSRRGSRYSGLDDGGTEHGPAIARELIDRPAKNLKGEIPTLVLLVDFPDKPHSPDRSPSFYDQMLFSKDRVLPSGSMRDYFRSISNWEDGGGGIDVVGEVFGWFRMPQPLSFYTDGSSGMDGTFPRNAQAMARDAVLAAKAQGLDWKTYDVLGEGFVTALFIIHAGRGAETTGDRADIWSHKWVIPQGVEVAQDVEARTYLTVPEDCRVGVCAHEWGHLAARWADYYDTGMSKNLRSNGLGDYCLMASGSWGDNGLTPTLPNGMLRLFHGWIEPLLVTKSKKDIVLKPAAEGGSVVVIRNPAVMSDTQYVLVEYRRKGKQDAFLPSEGIAVYMIDEAIKSVNEEDLLAIELIQADNQRDLAKIFGQGNRGDRGDLYPSNGNSRIAKTTKPPLDLPDHRWSGISIRVKGNPGAPEMAIDVEIT